MQFEKFKRFQQFLGKNILSIDYGSKKFGLATFIPGNDPYPLPYAQWKNHGELHFFQQIAKLINDELIEVLVLGVPKLLDGKETDMSQKIRQFGAQLSLQFPALPLYYQDETLSSFEAENRMKNSPRFNFKIDKNMLDAWAAAIILEDFIQAEGIIGPIAN